MEEVTPEVYQNNFQKIFDWFQNNVHVGSEQFRYDIIGLPHTHLKMVDIVNEPTDKVYFRVIVKATYQDVEVPFLPTKNYKEIDYLFNTKSAAELTNIAGFQVCYVQLNNDDKPVHGILYTYSPHDEKYHTFKLPKAD